MVTRIGVFGANGRMGRMILRAVLEAGDAALSAAGVRAGSADSGADAGALAGLSPVGLMATDRVAEVLAADVAIDFTLPDATLSHAAAAAAAGVPFVTGTTGLSAGQEAELARLATRIPVVYAPNMSVGVNLCFKLLELAAGVLGDDFDVEVIEAHHRHKVDAPSGTAVRMGEILAATLGRDLADCAVYGRQGHTGPRERKTIGFETIRAGEIVGDHTVLFAGAGEVVEITHRAANRATFAAGALRAAAWLASRGPGCYDMQDVLGLR